MMRIHLALWLFAVLFSGCSPTEPAPLPITEDSVAVAQPPPDQNPLAAGLPFSYSYPDAIADRTGLQDFLRSEGVPAKRSALDHYFSPRTPLTGRADAYGHPYGGRARLFRRLTDWAGHKVLLFAYWDKETDYKLPTLELQVFAPGWRLTDKMIVVDGTVYECSWQRSVHISSDYEIRITDRDVCYDVEADTQISDTESTTLYRLDTQGKIRRADAPAARPQTPDWNGRTALPSAPEKR